MPKHTSIISCDIVSNIFLDELLMTYTMELYRYLSNGQASKRTRKHFVLVNCVITLFEDLRQFVQLSHVAVLFTCMGWPVLFWQFSIPWLNIVFCCCFQNSFVLHCIRRCRNCVVLSA